VTASFGYDALGRRASRTVNGTATAFQYDGLDVVKEIVGSTVTHYLHGAGIDEPLVRGGEEYYLADALGSVVRLTDPSGAIATEYRYEPFGRVDADGPPSGNPVQYTGRENDETGLYYYRARYYHPQLQRFLSEDPIGFAGGDPNLYSYVFNRPTVLTDPLGLQYKDLNISVGYGVGVTFGVLVEGNKIYPYLGGGLMTPGIGASLTASPSSVTQGWQVGLQGAAGVAGQVGYSFGTGGGWFWEAGIGGGWPTFAGGSLTGYYVFGPAASSRAMATDLQIPTAFSSEPPTLPLAAPKMSGRK
jgi:RHS repeat-associated protein